MGNYYDFLKVQPTASIAEIQAVLDTLYNQSRRLVTHHDPHVVQSANQDLLMIEQARSTLLDPAKRADYDVMLSLSNIGGLADESVNPSPMPVMTPPMVRRPSVVPSFPQTGAADADMWLCPKCFSSNPIGTKFCKKCGNQLGRNCPQCNTLLEATAQFCSDCGVNIREYEQEREIQVAEAERQRVIEERRIAEQNARLGIIIKASNDATNFTKFGWIVSVVGSCIPLVNVFAGLAGLGLFVLAVVNAQKALSQSQQYGDQVYRSKARTALWLSGLPIGLAILGICLYLLLLVSSGAGN